VKDVERDLFCALAMTADAHGQLIALSGYARREDEEASLASGFDIHLVKPVRADVIERHLRGIVHPVRPRALRLAKG